MRASFFTASAQCLALAAALVACGSDTEPSPASSDTGKTGTDATSGENRAPELFKIGDKIVEVGSTLVIEPRAVDPDNDTLSWSILGDVPEDATVTKNPPRFQWTPTSAPAELYTTFVVSDGLETDRETVLIRVVSESNNHPPVFQTVGDQAVEIGQSLVLQLQATDPDGDTLTFGSETLPAGATLDPSDGRFAWTPAGDLAGTTVTVPFTVSDATETASLSVVIHVLAPGQNKPPSFAPLPPQVAEVGEAWALALNPTDPDGDPLECGMQGTPPAGAAFDPPSCSLNWTPTEDQAGKTWNFVFSVNDGTYTIFQDVDVQVKLKGQQPGQCMDDANEPNNEAAFATQLTVGTWENLSICDTDLSPVDQDWYAVSLTQGQTLSITLTFEHDYGDIDLAVYKTSDLNNPVAWSDSATDDEKLAWPATQTGTILVRVYGTGQSTFSAPYTMTLSTAGLDCTDDDLEPNNTPGAATPLLIGDAANDLMYCPSDLDWFSVDLQCGQTLGATLAANQAQGNLDLYLYRAVDSEVPVASATAESGSTESAFYEAITDETALILVRGEPAESTENSYSLSTQSTGTATCSDDQYEPNDTKGTAVQLTSPVAELTGLETCCDPDWFFVPLAVGDGMLVQVIFGAAKTMNAGIYRVDGDVPVGTVEPDVDGLLLTLESAMFAGNYYVRVEGSAGTAYDLTMVVLENEGCLTSKGCDDDEVCIKATGQCVKAICSNDSQCPSGQEMPCVAGQCLDGCTYDADCKLSYACKGFEFGKYCGPKGSKTLGESCSDMTECAGSASCAFEGSGGYCTFVGCTNNSECATLGGSCVQHKSTTVCGLPCESNNDCRSEDGYTCQPKTLPNGLPADVCLPTN